MKRSTVVDIIASWAKPEILQDIYSNNTQEWADNLLYTLETEIGMLPPYNPQHLDHGSIQDCEWTPEEEIKELQDET